MFLHAWVEEVFREQWNFPRRMTKGRRRMALCWPVNSPAKRLVAMPSRVAVCRGNSARYTTSRAPMRLKAFLDNQGSLP